MPSGQRPTETNPVDEFVSQRVAEACRALWWEEIIRRALILVIALILCVLFWVVIDQWVYSAGRLSRAFAFTLIVGTSVWYVFRRIVPVLTSTVRPEYAARALERDLPEMKQELTSYIMLRNSSISESTAGVSSSRLHDRVVKSIGSIAAGRLRQHDALPSEATSTLRWWIVAAGALALLMAYTVVSPKSTIASAGRLLAPLAKIQPAKRVAILDVQPGDVEAIAGRAVAVSAKIDGLRDNESPVCRWQSSNRDHEFDLLYNSESRRFEGVLQLSHSDANRIPYSIVAGDDQSGPHWLSVKNLPVVAIESVRYEPPAYTGEIAHTSSSASISAVDGTLVTITAKTNRPVVRADIEFNPKTVGEVVRATAGSKSMKIDADGTHLTISFPLQSNLQRSAAVQLDSYRIRVRDDADQDNPEPIVYPIRVIADLPPEVSIVLPRKSPKSMSVELQQIIEIHAMDPDFGLKSVELKIRRGIDVIKNPTLWSNDDGAKGNQVTEYRFRPSEHGLRVGDVVRISGVATDNRNVPGDENIKANVSETDPVEIRIVDDQPAPDPQGADDGLSETDQRPASDHPEDNAGGDKSASQDGDQKQGGSGGKGESSQQQQGDGGSESGQSGEGQKGEGEKGESQGSDSQGEKGDGKGSSSDAGENSSESSGNPQDMNDESNGDSSGNSGKGKPGSEGSSGDQSSDQQPGDSSGEPMSNGDSARSEGQNNGDPSGEGNVEQAQGDGGADSQSADGPPKHDGEAFEKIRDYLENKKKNDQQKPSSHQGDRSKSDDSQGADDSLGKAQGDDQNAGSDPKNAGGDESGTGESMDDGNMDEGKKPDRSNSAGANPDGSKPDSQSDSSKGDSPNGKSGTDSKSPNENQGSPSGEGDQKQNANGEKSDQGSGEHGSDPQGSKSQPMNDEQGKGNEAGQGSDDDGSPQEGAGEGASGEQPKGNEAEQGQAGKGEQPSGDQAGNQSQANDDSSPSGDSMSPDDQGDQSKSQGDGKSNPGSKAQDPASNGQPGEQTSPKGDSQNGPSSQSGDPRKGQPQNNAAQNGNPQGGDSSAAGSDSGMGEAGEGPLAPEAADLEYTKKATDMVLDYLEETRDAPDRELLDKLDWSENDLEQFAQRWKQTRQMDSPAADPKQQNQLRDALESLGLRPPAGDASDVRREKADDLRAIRDSGNRRPPPAAYRDVFDAYRRGLGRQK
ncbi:MAG: hypothetical protein WBD20_12480 [Pirellulaceae bacterium]